MLDREGKSENLCDKKKPTVQCCSKTATPGKAKSGKMFGSPLALSLRRSHSHHLKRRDRGGRGEMGESAAKQQLQTVEEEQHTAAWS